MKKIFGFTTGAAFLILGTIFVVLDFFVIFAWFLIVLGAVAVLGSAVNLIREKYYLAKFADQTVDIDQMSGEEFELFLCGYFADFGYKYQRVGGSGDFGADIILTKKGKKIAVQAKRYTGNVGIAAVQQAAGARSYYKADEAWVVTNSCFTSAARQLAKSTDVKLIDGQALNKSMD